MRRTAGSAAAPRRLRDSADRRGVSHYDAALRVAVAVDSPHAASFAGEAGADRYGERADPQDVRLRAGAQREGHQRGSARAGAKHPSRTLSLSFLAHSQLFTSENPAVEAILDKITKPDNRPNEYLSECHLSEYYLGSLSLAVLSFSLSSHAQLNENFHGFIPLPDWTDTPVPGELRDPAAIEAKQRAEEEAKERERRAKEKAERAKAKGKSDKAKGKASKEEEEEEYSDYSYSDYSYSEDEGEDKKGSKEKGKASKEQEYSDYSYSDYSYSEEEEEKKKEKKTEKKEEEEKPKKKEEDKPKKDDEKPKEKSKEKEEYSDYSYSDYSYSDV